MRLYDLSLIMHPHITDVELPAALEDVRKEIQAFGARELQEEQLGKLRLAYPVKGSRFGHVIYFRFEMEESVLRELKQKLNLQPEVIRSMISVVRNGLPFKIVYKPLRRGGHKNSNQYQSRAVAGGHNLPVAPAPASNVQFEPTLPSLPETAPKVDFEELDKRIDDLLTKETF